MEYTQDNLKNVLLNPKICAICINSCHHPMSRIEEDIEITIMNYNCCFNLKLVIEELFGNNITPLTDYMCRDCKRQVIDFFIFKHKFLRNVEIYEHLVTQLEWKTSDLLEYCSINHNVALGSTLIVLDKHPDYFLRTQEAVLENGQVVNSESEDQESKEVAEDEQIKSDKKMICDCCNNIYSTKSELIEHMRKLDPKTYSAKSRARYNKDQKLMCCTSTPCPHARYMVSIRAQKDLNELDLKCIDCEFTSRTFSGIIVHINQEHLDIHYECKTCGFAAPSWYRLHLHRRACDKPRCPSCGRPVKPDEIQSHLEQCGKTIRQFQCDYCPDSFKNKARLTMHLKSHLDTFDCDLCGRDFLTDFDLKRHKIRFHKSNTNIKVQVYRCSVCGVRCNDVKHLQIHVETHNKNEKHICKLCDVGFDTTEEYRAHLRRITHKKVEETHDKLSLFAKGDMLLNRYSKCSICGKKCSSHTKLQAHLSTHGSHEKHKCIPCKLEFDGRKQYLRHIVSPEHIERCYPESAGLVLRCDNCAYTTTSEARLKRHVGQQHLRPKQLTIYTCQFCHKIFTVRFIYKNHLIRHISNRNNVQRVQNTGPRVCDVCGKTVNSGVAMIKHRRLHTGERPYPCPLCEQAYISSSQRNLHIMRSHSEKTIECPICHKWFHTMCNARGHVRKTHWKSSEPFDYKKLPGDPIAIGELFKDRRLLM